MSVPTPYYDDGKGIVIYLGDCREILPHLPKVELVLTDPPYGINSSVDNSRFTGGTKTRTRFFVNERIAVHDDNKPFDPSSLLQFNKLIIWGANNFAGSLPSSNGWLVWDKRKSLEHMEGWPLGEAELAWSNVTGAVRVFRNRWMGMVRDSELKEFHHPTQKPVELMKWCIDKSNTAGTILDPFMGSGTTLRAAKDLGRKCIGIEIEERYAEIAARRLEQEVIDFGGPSEKQGKGIQSGLLEAMGSEE